MKVLLTKFTARTTFRQAVPTAALNQTKEVRYGLRLIENLGLDMHKAVTSSTVKPDIVPNFTSERCNLSPFRP